MLDPYYRKFQGFQILIQKEWLWFGHKFADRNGNFNVGGIPKSKNERSPIFIQWLDCVYQVMHQFPWAFEFNAELLLEIAEHLNSGRFGDFYCNYDKTREELELWLKTPCIWKHLDSLWNSGHFRNPEYIPTKTVLRPHYSVRDLVLWDELYCRFTMHDKDRRLQRTVDYFTRNTNPSISYSIPFATGLLSNNSSNNNNNHNTSFSVTSTASAPGMLCFFFFFWKIVCWVGHRQTWK